jgi:hypothetical protein
MPKTSDSVAQPCAKIEIQPGCTGSWTDIGGESSVITLPKEVVATGSMAVFNDDTHILSTGKKDPVTATIQFVYTETAGEAWELLKAAWLTEGCEKLMCVRATPKGGTVGDGEIYIGENNTDKKAFLSGLKPPDLSAGDATPANGEFDVYGNYSYNTKSS